MRKTQFLAKRIFSRFLPEYRCNMPTVPVIVVSYEAEHIISTVFCSISKCFQSPSKRFQHIFLFPSFFLFGIFPIFKIRMTHRMTNHNLSFLIYSTEEYFHGLHVVEYFIEIIVIFNKYFFIINKF